MISQKLDRRDLFTFIGESKYRLRIVPNNISIDKTLLEEFSESAENTRLQSPFCNYCNRIHN